MIAVPDIGVDLGIDYSFAQVACNIDIIDPPPFVLKPDGRETLAPPGITMSFGMDYPKTVNPVLLQKAVHPGSFIR